MEKINILEKQYSTDLTFSVQLPSSTITYRQRLFRKSYFFRRCYFLEIPFFIAYFVFTTIFSIYCLITTPDNTGVFRPKIHWMHKVVQSAENPSFKYHDLFLQ